MNPILFTLSQDPIAVMEFIAAILTACYLLRLARLPLGLESETDVATPTAARTKRSSLREKLLRFFAVGETVTVAKRSLRWQSVRLQTGRLYFW